MGSEDEHPASITAHALAQRLLQLPDRRVVLVRGAGYGTIDYRLDSAPWFAEHLGQVRIMITDAHACADSSAAGSER